MEKFEEIAEKYEASLGLRQKIVKNPVDDYLNMALDDMRKLSQSECKEIALILSQYSIFIQREYNTQINIANTAKNHLHRIIVADMQQIKAYSFEEKKVLAIKGNEAAFKMEQRMNEALFKSKQIENLANLIEKVAKAYDNLSFVKRVL